MTRDSDRVVTEEARYPDTDPNDRLEALVGSWHTQGWTREEAGPAPERIDATDTYAWLPGGAALLHLVDATVGENKVEGAEIIGYDDHRKHYATLYFGTDGQTAFEADLTETDGHLVWEMRSAGSRFHGSFDADGGLITGHWQLLVPGSGWRPWMEITLTKQAREETGCLSGRMDQGSRSVGARAAPTIDAVDGAGSRG